MALKTIMGNSGRKASSLEVGQSIEGYLLGLSETKFNFAIKLLTKDGQVETLYPNGNLNYVDQEIEDGNVLLNVFTKITRTGTRTSTKSRDPQTGEWRSVPVFQLAQDTDDVITVDDATAALANDKANSSENTPEANGNNKFANRKR